jgi:hypothetical protein
LLPALTAVVLEHAHASAVWHAVRTVRLRSADCHSLSIQ